MTKVLRDKSRHGTLSIQEIHKSKHRILQTTNACKARQLYNDLDNFATILGFQKLLSCRMLTQVPVKRFIFLIRQLVNVSYSKMVAVLNTVVLGQAH